MRRLIRQLAQCLYNCICIAKNFQITILLISVIFFIVFNYKKKHSMKENVVLYVLCLYSACLIVLTVLGRTELETSYMRLVPFWTYIQCIKGRDGLVAEIMINIAMMIPYGFLLPSVFDCTFRRTVWIVGLLEILIETSQFILKRGLCEIDDIFHGIIGCLIGMGILHIIQRRKKRC